PMLREVDAGTRFDQLLPGGKLLIGQRGWRWMRPRPHVGNPRIRAALAGSPLAFVRQLEACHRVLQLLRHQCKVTDGARGGGRAGGRLRGDLLDDIHGVGDMAGGRRLLPRGVGDVLDELGELLRYALDLFECFAGVLRQTGTAHHLGGGLLHRDNRFVGVGLNGLDQRFDLFRGCGGTLSQTLYFVRYHREAAAGVTGHRRLDGGVEREDVGLVGDVVDERDDVADFLRRFAETLDPLRRFLDLLANVIHALDGVLYHLGAGIGDRNRALGHRGRFGGVGRYLVDGHGHLVDRCRGAGDFLRLVLRCLRQIQRGGLRFLRRLRYLQCGFVDLRYQNPQLVDGEVDRVGDGAGEVFGYRRRGGEVTVGEIGQFVEQTQNGVLVAFVLLGGLAQ